MVEAQEFHPVARSANIEHVGGEGAGKENKVGILIWSAVVWSRIKAERKGAQDRAQAIRSGESDRDRKINRTRFCALERCAVEIGQRSDCKRCLERTCKCSTSESQIV